MGDLYTKVTAAFLEIQVHDHGQGFVVLFQLFKAKIK